MARLKARLNTVECKIQPQIPWGPEANLITSLFFFTLNKPRSSSMRHWQLIGLGRAQVHSSALCGACLGGAGQSMSLRTACNHCNTAMKSRVKHQEIAGAPEDLRRTANMFLFQKENQGHCNTTPRGLWSYPRTEIHVKQLFRPRLSWTQGPDDACVCNK